MLTLIETYKVKYAMYKSNVYLEQRFAGTNTG